MLAWAVWIADIVAFATWTLWEAAVAADWAAWAAVDACWARVDALVAIISSCDNWDVTMEWFEFMVLLSTMICELIWSIWP